MKLNLDISGSDGKRVFDKWRLSIDVYTTTNEKKWCKILNFLIENFDVYEKNRMIKRILTWSIVRFVWNQSFILIMEVHKYCSDMVFTD